jgi:hypothetical protein
MTPSSDLVLVALPKAEVVWGERTAVNRVILRSIPGPASGFRWLDEVRVIPATLAELAIDDVDYPVLPAPEVVERSGIPTLLARVACADELDLSDLVEEFDTQGARCEEWTAATDEPNGPLRTRGVAIAATADDAGSTLRIWIDEAPDRRALLEIDEAP